MRNVSEFSMRNLSALVLMTKIGRFSHTTVWLVVIKNLISLLISIEIDKRCNIYRRWSNPVNCFLAHCRNMWKQYRWPVHRPRKDSLCPSQASGNRRLKLPPVSKCTLACGIKTAYWKWQMFKRSAQSLLMHIRSVKSTGLTAVIRCQEVFLLYACTVWALLQQCWSTDCMDVSDTHLSISMSFEIRSSVLIPILKSSRVDFCTHNLMYTILWLLSNVL